MTGAWYSVQQARARCDVRVVCFPYAGGSASIFRGWSAWMPPTAELWTAHLPGRDRRISEEPYSDVASLVGAAVDAFVSYIEPPYALFGHSMGAIVAFEFAHELARRGAAPPLCLVVSGQHAPHLADDRPPIHDMPDADFLDAVGRLNGTPREVRESAEIMDLLMPVLRADFAAVETYTCGRRPPLRCPIVAYAATDDELITPDQVSPWSEHSTSGCRVVMFSGGHFFVQSSAERVARQLGQDVLDAVDAQATGRRAGAS
jgi:surfactin synthase thioesterase subunit